MLHVMTLLSCVVGGLVILVALAGVRRAVRRLPPSPTSQAQWDVAMRTLAYASPGFVCFQPLADVHLLSDEELCQAWCFSYEAVTTAKSARQLSLAAEKRRSYLAELERRHPLAVSEWLASGASASDDPLPYLGHDLGDR